MDTDECCHPRRHHMGDRDTHPIEPRCDTLAALLLPGPEALAHPSREYPASSSRLASAPHRSPLGRVQLLFLGPVSGAAEQVARRVQVSGPEGLIDRAYAVPQQGLHIRPRCEALLHAEEIDRGPQAQGR
jgi:hypothetical protein